MAVYAFDPRTWKVKAGRSPKFEVFIACRVTKQDTVSKTTTQNLFFPNNQIHFLKLKNRGIILLARGSPSTHKAWAGTQEKEWEHNETNTSIFFPC